MIPASASASASARQGLNSAGTQTPLSSRWGSGWLSGGGAGAQHAEIVPAQKLAWGER